MLDGEVRATVPGPTTATAATWRIAIELRVRFTPGAGTPAIERTIRRESDFLGGTDPLETEGRRALALRRAAADAGRELLRALER